MRRLWTFALRAGVIVAARAAGTMVPLPFPTPRDKRTAILAAAVERFCLGFVIGPAARGLGANGLAVGLLLGLGLSIPSALITKSYAPILDLGLLFGLGVGLAYQFVY